MMINETEQFQQSVSDSHLLANCWNMLQLCDGLLCAYSFSSQFFHSYSDGMSFQNGK